MTERTCFVVELQETERGPRVFADIGRGGGLTVAYDGRPGIRFFDAESAERFRQHLLNLGIPAYSIRTSKVLEVPCA